MKRLLADAGKPDVPGLYVSRGCSYFWDTVPHLARDVRGVKTWTQPAQIMPLMLAAMGCCVLLATLRLSRIGCEGPG